MVHRIYRVEVFANNGMLMGHTDIANETDMKVVLGGNATNLLKSTGAGGGADMHEIFDYIANEKLGNYKVILRCIV
jgi:hypothetical protein